MSPADFGLPEHELTTVKGGDAAFNAKTMVDLLNGRLTGPVLDFVLLNSAALLFVVGKAASLKDVVKMARESIISLNAKKEFEMFKAAGSGG